MFELLSVHLASVSLAQLYEQFLHHSSPLVTLVSYWLNSFRSRCHRCCAFAWNIRGRKKQKPDWLMQPILHFCSTWNQSLLCSSNPKARRIKACLSFWLMRNSSTALVLSLLCALAPACTGGDDPLILVRTPITSITFAPKWLFPVIRPGISLAIN